MNFIYNIIKEKEKVIKVRRVKEILFLKSNNKCDS